MAIILRPLLRARMIPRAGSASSPRSYRASPPLHRPPYKDSQDRTSLKPRTHEGTASGFDEDVSAQRDAAFDPSKTAPEAEKRAAGTGNDVNPLEASGANQELSTPMGADESRALNTGPGKGEGRRERSKGRSAQKKGRPGRVS